MLSEKILLARAGNFTASENHRLMSGWDKESPDRDYPEFEILYSAIKTIGSKPLVGNLKNIVDCSVTGALIEQTWKIIQSEKPPAGLVTYAQEKAIEEFFDPDPSLNFSTVHTRNGEEREAECMAILAERTGLKFVNIGDDQAHIHVDGVGCTPDGIVLDALDLVDTGAEVKCKSPLEHAKNLLINNNDDLRINAFDHFVQIQTCMLVTDADRWYFANFNPYAKDDAMKFKFIIIKRDDAFIKILIQRIDLAKEVKASFWLNMEKLRVAV